MRRRLHLPPDQVLREVRRPRAFVRGGSRDQRHRALGVTHTSAAGPAVPVAVRGGRRRRAREPLVRAVVARTRMAAPFGPGSWPDGLALADERGADAEETKKYGWTGAPSSPSPSASTRRRPRSGSRTACCASGETPRACSSRGTRDAAVRDRVVTSRSFAPRRLPASRRPSLTAGEKRKRK